MATEKKNILIVGSGAVVSALAKKLSLSPFAGKIFAAPGGKIKSDYYETVDIREDDLTGLLKFVLENDINLTIPVSQNALKADIVSFFLENQQNIFGATENACKIATNNIYGKKFLYKIHAQTAKFGVYDKLAPALEYLKNVDFPVTIKCSEYNGIEDRLVCPTMPLAVKFLDTLFAKNETGVMVEEYAYGLNFTVYYVTDGYSALPITVVRNYKFMEDGDGGLLTNGVGCFAPDYKVSEIALGRVDNVVKNTLNSLEKKGSPYVGILGVDCTMTGEDKFLVNEFKPFLQDFDAAAVLNLIEDDLIEVFSACVDGIFADEWEEIKLNNLASVSACAVSKHNNKVINGLEYVEDLDNIDFSNVQKTADEKYLTGIGQVFVMTKTASTLTRAKSYLYEDMACLKFDGMKYRKDICL